LIEAGSGALDLGEARRWQSTCRAWVVVVDGEVVLDVGDQVGDAGEDAASQVLVGQLAEPALDLVEP
jgi:hypothetical protein